MAALLAAMLSLSTPPAMPLAPLEPSATDSLREAQRVLRAGDPGRALATLDSLVMSDGVTVAVEPANPQEGAVAKGLESWNVALGERAFRLRPAGAPADVVVRFVRSLDEEGGDVQGYVKASRAMSWSRDGHAYRLKGVILVRDNLFGRPLRADEATTVVAHEAGHLLGLADVSRRDRLMGPLCAGHPLGPCADEVAAVVEYRSLIRRSYPKEGDAGKLKG